MNLVDEVRDLVQRAGGVSPDRLDGPLRVAVTGQPRSGKSTVADALRGSDVEIVEDEPDAVIYLVRHVQHADLAVLEEFHDRMNTIIVLARADEIGGGRLDAMTSAHQIARRYAADHRLRGRCQAVVPVAGLLTRPLTGDVFDALATLAARPRAEVDAVLLSADRIADRPLLDRLGMFGIRLGVTLIRQGFDNSAKLGTELARRSGIDDLREQIAIHFSARAQLLKARSVLLELAKLQQNADVERVLTGAHEFAEIRLLDALRAGRVQLPADLLDEAERLLGAHGASVAARLGQAADHKTAALDALIEWQRIAENPRSSRQLVHTARVIVRTCEGILADITIGQPV